MALPELSKTSSLDSIKALHRTAALMYIVCIVHKRMLWSQIHCVFRFLDRAREGSDVERAHQILDHADALLNIWRTLKPYPVATKTLEVLEGLFYLLSMELSVCIAADDQSRGPAISSLDIRYLSHSTRAYELQHQSPCLPFCNAFA